MSKITEKISGILNEKIDTLTLLDNLVLANNKIVGVLKSNDLKKITPLWKEYRKALYKALDNVK